MYGERGDEGTLVATCTATSSATTVVLIVASYTWDIPRRIKILLIVFAALDNGNEHPSKRQQSPYYYCGSFLFSRAKQQHGPAFERLSTATTAEDSPRVVRQPHGPQDKIGAFRKAVPGVCIRAKKGIIPNHKPHVLLWYCTPERRSKAP